MNKSVALVAVVIVSCLAVFVQASNVEQEISNGVTNMGRRLRQQTSDMTNLRMPNINSRQFSMPDLSLENLRANLQGVPEEALHSK